MILAFGAVFELPLMFLFVARIGIVNKVIENLE
jgi:Sec-independent protein secretion pathway component TatC